MRKHTQIEIRDKLAQAASLASAGQTQAEIVKQLGISVMTLHRWRNHGEDGDDHEDSTEDSLRNMAMEQADLIQSLTEENRRLKRIVVDQLLERERHKDS